MKANKPARAPWVISGLIIVSAVASLVYEIFSNLFPTTAALANAITGAIFLIVSAVVAALIISWQPHNIIGRFMLTYSLCTALFGPISDNINRMITVKTPISLPLMLYAWFSGWAWWLLIGPILLILLFFPTGRLVSPRWRGAIVVLALGFSFFVVFATFYPTFTIINTTFTYANPIGWIPPALANLLFIPFEILLMVTTGLCVAAVFVRYRRARAVERTQIKWLLYACVIFLVNYGIGTIASDNKWYGAFLNISLTGIPLAIGAAILRYHLWDIDFLIRRTLSYTVLTGLLALVYFGGVTLLQNLFSLASGLNSTLAILISTLLIATLFSPLRRKVQTVIDRRFFRQEYNSQQTLETFVDSARNLTGLDELAAEVMQVAQQTLKPASINLWLKKS